MKLFIHASSDSSNSNVVNTVYVTMNVYMPYIKISAATDDELENIIHRSIINPRTDKPYSSLYRALLDQIINAAEGMGLKCLRNDRSKYVDPNLGRSYSRYLDFCISDMIEQQIVRIVCSLRVSDHSGNTEKIEDHEDDALFNYERFSIEHEEKRYKIGKKNTNAGRIEAQYYDIIVGTKTCGTIYEAVNMCKIFFQEYIDLESMPYTDGSVRHFIESIENKYNKMNLRHRWEFTNNLLTTGDCTDFELVFSENGEDKVVLKFLYSKGRFTVTFWKSFSSKKEIVNMMIGDNKINPFGRSELTKLFDKFIEPAIYKIDNM